MPNFVQINNHMSPHIKNVSQYQKRNSQEIQIGTLLLGGANPLRIQSMTTTDTNDIEASVNQSVRILEAGGELVRLTTQGIREAQSIGIIKTNLVKKGFAQPIVADVHFNAKVAFTAAELVDKVRINPGNFTDPVKRFEAIEYTDALYALELEKIEEKFVPFLETCKQNGTAIRIGVNHGSLSDRIMSKYGDTPEGMVESCMEYLRIAVAHQFKNIVISVKASNTRIMVQTVRLLVHVMEAEKMNFPLHLGVTEAGEGEDGRIKSAVGIGALLADGIGDTIRVSLSEDPECEIPVCITIKEHFEKYTTTISFPTVSAENYSPFQYNPRKSSGFYEIGAEHLPVVAVGVVDKIVYIEGSTPEWVFDASKNQMTHVSSEEVVAVETPDAFHPNDPGFIRCTINDLNENLAHDLKDAYKCIIARAESENVFTELRAFVLRLMDLNITCPVIVELAVPFLTEQAKVKVACDVGGLFIDGLVDGILVRSDNAGSNELTSFGLSVLQAARARFSKTEYISCPGCGRTLFNLQTTIAKVKKETAHLKGLKIAIMGCIVNGPGEMADADFGYVGAGKGRISLYKGKECLKKGIPEDDAIPELINILKAHNAWVEPVK